MSLWLRLRRNKSCCWLNCLLAVIPGKCVEKLKNELPRPCRDPPESLTFIGTCPRLFNGATSSRPIAKRNYFRHDSQQRKRTKYLWPKFNQASALYAACIGVKLFSARLVHLIRKLDGVGQLPVSPQGLFVPACSCRSSHNYNLDLRPLLSHLCASFSSTSAFRAPDLHMPLR